MLPLPRKLIGCLFWLVGFTATFAGATAAPPPRFRVIAFYTGKDDLAHVSFVREANRWLPEAARQNNFSYEATTDWTKLNTAFLAGYQVADVDQMPFQDLIRTANQQGLLRGDWPAWHRFRDLRARTSHTYHAETAALIASEIPSFLDEAEYLCAQLLACLT